MPRHEENYFEGMTQAKDAYDYPKKPHYAVIFFTTQTVCEHDYYPEEHGGSYPTKTDINSFEYWHTEDIKVWEKYLELLYAVKPSRGDIAAFQVGNVAQINKKIQINLV